MFTSTLALLLVSLFATPDAAAATDGETLYAEGNKRSNRALVIGSIGAVSLTSALVLEGPLENNGQDVEWLSVLGGGGVAGTVVSASMLLRGTTRARLGVELMGGSVSRSGLLCMTAGVAAVPVGVGIYGFFAQFSDVMLQSDALFGVAATGFGIGMGCGVLQHRATNAEYNRISTKRVSSHAEGTGSTPKALRRERMRLTPAVMNQQPGLVLSGSF